MSLPPALVVLTEKGAATARRLLQIFPEAEIYAREGRITEAHVFFSNSMEIFPALFARGRPIVAFCAAGIVIRALAQRLGEKQAEPPVLALSEGGEKIVPLLGGHRGAYALAQEIAAQLGGTVASTGAGENRFGVLLDAPPSEYHLANKADYPAFIAKLLQQESVRLECADDEPPPLWLKQSRLPWKESASLSIHVTIKECAGSAKQLVYHPKVLTLGVGCERGVEADEVITLVQKTLKQAGLAREAIAAVASLDLKADESAFMHLEEMLQVPMRFFSAEELERETPRLANPSEEVFAAVGCHGVAEASALAAAGKDGVLLLAKQKSARATCAIARAGVPVNAEHVGRGRGSLAIIGLGPGDASMRSLEAEAALAHASDIVGYHLYLRLLGSLTQGKRIHGFELGEEQARADKALELASQGHRVALVSSGDAGIYAMASPLFEALEQQGGQHGFALQVVPGISALQAAAAKSGAPLGHDFAAISLSDLLTPWERIETRLRMALQGDFVLALYNPVSKRRKHRLERALELLRDSRDTSTPVVVAQNLGRTGENVRILTLGDINADDIDMMTILLVGSSQTRRCGDWVYTPRGYKEAK